MEVQKWIDHELPRAHGNRLGLSYGQLAVLLLTYMISQSDHRLCAVESWVKRHHHSLACIIHDTKNGTEKSRHLPPDFSGV